MQPCICSSSSSSMRATGMPAWMVAITACTASSTLAKLQTAAEIASGTPYSLTVTSVMMPERALRAHEQPGEIVAGRRLARPAAGADHPAVGQHHGQAQHVLLHRAVADGVGARRAGRGHAAEGGVGARVDREEQAGVAQMRVELLAGDARPGRWRRDPRRAPPAPRFICVRSSETPPATAATWPSSEVPAPNATTGTRCSAQTSTTRPTSSVERAKATASGGCTGWCASPRPCCSRSAAAVVNRSPRSCRSAAKARVRSGSVMAVAGIVLGPGLFSGA